MEIWDLYDREGNKTGETHVRGEELPADRYHLVMHFWVRHSNGQVLGQKRAKDVSQWPGYWSTTGGSALRGEDSLQCLHREVMEEIGLDLNKFETPPMLWRRWRESFMTDVFVLESDEITISDLTFGPEVETARYFSREEILDFIEKDLMVPFSTKYLDTIFGS